MSGKFENDYYIVDENFRLLSFNQSVKERYKGIKIGDLCYKVIMNRESPCLHCPIAGNGDNSSLIYFNPFYNAFVEAVFSNIGEGKYSVICRLAKNSDALQIINAISLLFHSVYKIDLRNGRFMEIKTIPRIHDLIGTTGNSQEALNRIVTQCVDEKYKEKMYSFIDMSTWEERLRLKTLEFMEYKENDNNWTRAYMIVSKRDHIGKVTEIIYAIQEINEQKNAERQLKKAIRKQEEYISVIHGLSSEYHTVWLITERDMKMHFYRSSEKSTIQKTLQTGLDFSDYDSAISKYVNTYVVPEEREHVLSEVYSKTLKTRITKDDVYTVNYRRIDEEGNITYHQMAFAQAISESGEKNFVLAFRDIERMIRKEQRQQRMLEAQLEVIEGLGKEYFSVLLVDLDEDTVISYRAKGEAGEAISKYFSSNGNRWSDHIENYTNELVVEEDREQFYKELSLEGIRGHKEDYTFDYRKYHENGISHFQVRIVYVERKNGKKVVVVGTKGIDNLVRAQKERNTILEDSLAAAEHANRAKTIFLNNMSHDIRTPMNAIIGFTALAASHIDNKEQVIDYLNKISVSSNHLLSLINDVLDMSRIESGRVKIEEKNVHLPELLHDLRTIVQSSINAKQLDLFIDIVDVLNEDIIADKLRLNQILLNIVSNAIKFTKPGGTVSIRVIEKGSAPTGYANYEFRVKDTGIGIKQNFIEHIFEAFSREETPTVSGIQGTGLGMAITKNIIDMMGGTILVESEEGKGSEFIVSLQFKISGKPVKKEKIAELTGLRALVVDDDFNTCVSVTKMLNSIGMRSDWTTSGKEAVLRTQMAVEHKDEFSAYIIDWLMSDMNGIETVRRIRRIVGESKPIIILTAYDWADIEEEARDAGVTAFCSKPLFISELKDVLTQPYRIDCEEKKEKALDFSNKKILVVEDNELNQEIAVEILTEAGFFVEVAQDGRNAIEKMESATSEQYDLILMDVQMPHMDGYEATKRIRAMEDKKKANIPIIAMTANAFEEDRQNALDAGMNGHLAKPIQISKLLETLNILLN